MKKTFFIIACAAMAVACGNSTDTKTAEKKDSTTTASVSSTVSPDAEKALELIGSSDCTTCHKLNKEDTKGGPIGPVYTDVAAKYSPAADSTVDRLVKKVITGGTGVWGSLPMTPHPALKEADIRVIVKYILTLKK